jgi:hypothetical protein
MRAKTMLLRGLAATVELPVEREPRDLAEEMDAYAADIEKLAPGLRTKAPNPGCRRDEAHAAQDRLHR